MKKRPIVWFLLLALALVLIMAPMAWADASGDASGPGVDLTAVWVTITGFVTVFIVGLLTRKTWAAWKKVLVVVTVSAALGFAELALTGQTVWKWANWWPIMSAVFVLAKVWYEGIAWKIPGLKGWWESHGLKPAAGKS